MIALSFGLAWHGAWYCLARVYHEPCGRNLSPVALQQGRLDNEIVGSTFAQFGIDGACMKPIFNLHVCLVAAFQAVGQGSVLPSSAWQGRLLARRENGAPQLAQRSNRMLDSALLGSRVRRAHEPAGNLYSYLQRGLGKFRALRANRNRESPFKPRWMQAWSYRIF